MSTPRLVFAGTPEFARTSLETLIAGGFAPVAVLTQPDRPAGRGRRLAAGPVKACAIAAGLPVLQPVTLRDPGAVRDIAAYRPDLLIVVAYGLILPQAVLDLPRLGCLNVHASLLPRWRGAAPIQQAILAGDRETGVCLMRMDAGLDTGPVYARSATAIAAGETAGELHDRLAALGAGLLVATLPSILAGDVAAVPQEEAGATYAAKLRKEDARLDWQSAATELERRVRAYNPVPGAWFGFAGERITCWRASALSADGGPAGIVAAAGRDGVDVACGEGLLRLTEVQRPGRRPIRAAEFARQQPLAGKRFD